MVLLTGGAGFIGSHTAVELISAGYEVLIADNFSNSQPRVIDRIKRITNKNLRYAEIDISCPQALDELFQQNPISEVIHFAGYKAVEESVQKPIMYYRNNIDTTLTLLEIMNKHKVKRIVFSSSATVYGIPNKVPIKETDAAGGCTNPYGRTKYFIESMLSDSTEADNNMSVALLRYFNPIGAHESGLIGELPNGTPNNLMPYITQTAAGMREKLMVFGDDYPTRDGTGIRDYIHVVDLAKGHVAALKYLEENKGVEAFNLGTGRGHSVLEVIRAFETATGTKVPYEIGARRKGDIAECYACTEKAERMLRWKAIRTIEDMCRDSWRWQQNYVRGLLDGEKTDD